jgi:hypothetical protein
MRKDADRKANLALAWAVPPVIMVVISKVMFRMMDGWEAMAYHYMVLFVAAILSLIPIVLGITAIIRGTDHIGKSMVAIVLPPALVLLAMLLIF